MRTLVWNGPFGAFELTPFDAGTNRIAAGRGSEADASDGSAEGRWRAAAIRSPRSTMPAGVADDFTYISTAGGAFLEWLEGKDLPGVAALAKAGV